ncbi:MAG: sugar phosphate isomerase/epimerase, partial [Syntrophorhabdaceae bacterium]|nr:sugar phosphate isomerase/epimerase [Syntrophorhabdaceae bacterium]
IRFAIENMPIDSGRSDIIYDIVVRFPEDRVGVCIDVGHANIIETTQSAIRTAGKRLVHIHASDNHGEKDEHLIPGYGNIHWKTTIEELRKADFRGAFTLELRDLTRGDNPTYNDFGEILADARAVLAQIVGS